MKNLIVILSLTFLMLSCREENIKENTGLNLKFDFPNLKPIFSAEMDLNKASINQINEAILEYIYDDQDTHKSNVMLLHSANNKIYLNRPDSSNSRALDAPCPSQTKTCNSEQYVKTTIAEIIGDGNRALEIRYDRQAQIVTLSWTYKDCKK